MCRSDQKWKGEEREVECCADDEGKVDEQITGRKGVNEWMDGGDGGLMEN